MNQQEIMQKLEQIIEDVNTGILSTVDQDGRPCTRWMTPVLIKGRKGVIFTVTSPRSKKVEQIAHQPHVVWLVQTRALDQIITVKGKINILDNPAIKSELFERMGNKLTMFWKANEAVSEFVVLETVIEEAVYYQPMKACCQTVSFENSL